MPFVQRLSADERQRLRDGGATDAEIDAWLLALAHEARRCPSCQRRSCNCAEVRATDAHAERVAMGTN